MRALELKIPPPVVALIAGVAMWFVARHGVSLDVPLAARVGAFAIIALAGGAIALAGDLAFKRAKTTINPLKPGKSTTLVTTGIYRRTRNPMYAGMALILVGWAAFLCSIGTLFGPVAFVLYINRFQIVPEERALSSKFGRAYTAYASRVGRWL